VAVPEGFSNFIVNGINVVDDELNSGINITPPDGWKF